jgi:hypothetical protein
MPQLYRVKTAGPLLDKGKRALTFLFSSQAPKPGYYGLGATARAMNAARNTSLGETVKSLPLTKGYEPFRAHLDERLMPALGHVGAEAAKGGWATTKAVGHHFADALREMQFGNPVNFYRDVVARKGRTGGWGSAVWDRAKNSWVPRDAQGNVDKWGLGLNAAFMLGPAVKDLAFNADPRHRGADIGALIGGLATMPFSQLGPLAYPLLSLAPRAGAYIGSKFDKEEPSPIPLRYDADMVIRAIAKRNLRLGYDNAKTEAAQLGSGATGDSLDYDMFRRYE